VASVNPFSRLPVTLPDGSANAAAISDLYDKVESNQTTPPNLTTINSEIATLQQQVTALQAAITNLYNPNVTDLTGAPQFAFLPALPTIPSNNPTQGAPYAQDGLAILFTPNANKPGSLYRYAAKPYYQWSGPELGGIQVDTHANRVANYAAASYKLTLFFESDRQILYESNGTNWIYAGGVMQAAVASKPADLGTHDAGFLFLATDTPVTLWRWTGSAWVRELLPVLEDTHANRLSNYAPANYPIGTLFYETDRTVTYINKLITATPTWVYLTGVMIAAFSSLPTLGTADAGFLFVASDTLGILYWTGSAWAHLPGILVLNFATSAGSVSITAANFTYESNNSGVETFTLPDVTTVPGQVFAVKNSALSTSVLTLNAAAAQTIDGSSAFSFAPGEGCILQAPLTGTNWDVLAITRNAVLTPIVQSAVESSQLVLTTSYQDIPGLTLTLSRAGTWVITGCESFGLLATNGGAFMQLVAAGTPQSPFAPPVSANGSGSALYATSQTWVYAAAVNDIVKLQAKSGSGGGFTYTTGSAETGTLTAVWLHA
jgi:hypothetical protein